MAKPNPHKEYLNLVSMLLDASMDQDFFKYFPNIQAEDFIGKVPRARRTLPAGKFEKFMEHSKQRNNHLYYRLEEMFKSGYEWEDPFSTYSANMLEKIAYLPVYILTICHDEVFKRTGDFQCAEELMKAVDGVTFFGALIYGLINPFWGFTYAGWRGLSAFGALERESRILSYSFHEAWGTKTWKKYKEIHTKTRFHILDKIQYHVQKELGI